MKAHELPGLATYEYVWFAERLHGAHELPGLATYEYVWFAERLHDPRLLKRAVAVGRVGTLAVPCGGRRRAGWCWSYGAADGRRILGELAGRRGFPDVRLVRASRGYGPRVEWGEGAPPLPRSKLSEELADHAIREGLLYGYSDRAIVDFVAGLISQKEALAMLRAAKGAS